MNYQLMHIALEGGNNRKYNTTLIRETFILLEDITIIDNKEGFKFTLNICL